MFAEQEVVGSIPSGCTLLMGKENQEKLVLPELKYWICSICGKTMDEKGLVISVSEEIRKKNRGHESHGWCLECGCELGWHRE